MNRVIALVDCNNFYASCERLFRPELRDKPIVVLSNNDGCIVARSNEAKALGIAMGAPYFKTKAVIDKHDVQVFSSNYTLYGDLSSRVMATLQELEPEVEIYSIDEAFISLPATGNAEEYGRLIKAKVAQCVGIPVSVGIAPTKTLAKIANMFAKTDSRYGGVADLIGAGNIDDLLEAVEVGDVWGIGRRSTEKLNRRGIYSARQLRDSDDTWIRKRLTVTGLRTVMELRGIPCVHAASVHATKQSIISSRSFGQPVSTKTDLREAIATHISIAAAKLRAQGSVAGAIQVFFHTNRFKEDAPQYSGNLTLPLPQPSAYTPTLIKYALRGLEQVYKAGYGYNKAGVMLTDMTSGGCQQGELFGPIDIERRPLMDTLDKINRKWGRNTLQFAAAGVKKSWRMRQSFKSPAYTTNWREIPVVRA
ncbi:MAG: Y-family DNA polymerase [Thermodesulfobacteriota bacterium]